MTSPVVQSIEALDALIKTVPAVADKTISVYSQDQLLDKRQDLGLPAVGILYVGLQGREEESKTGLAATLVLDILLIGGPESCFSCTPTEDRKINLLNVLDDMRNAIKCQRNPTPGSRRVWQFVVEAPRQFSEDVLGYVQRWKVGVILKNRGLTT